MQVRLDKEHSIYINEDLFFRSGTQCFSTGQLNPENICQKCHNGTWSFVEADEYDKIFEKVRKNFM